jgi:hypothetical protein
VGSRTYDATKARAVSVASLRIRELRWIFRRQLEQDFGIDAQEEGLPRSRVP